MRNDAKKFEKQCRQHNIKLTPQRLAIYEVLSASSDHPSADTVFHRVRSKLRNISLDTVNRALITFSEIGLAFIVEGSGEVRRYDAKLSSHQHFKCMKCKRIVDFHHEPFNNIDIPEELAGKFEIIRRTVYFEGLCDECQNKDKHKNTNLLKD